MVGETVIPGSGDSGPAVEISYAITVCSLGLMLVAATEKGIRAVYLGDSEGVLESELGEECPGAVLRRDDAALAPWIDAVLRYLDGSEPRVDLPLDVRATAFQRRVWEELKAIPRGETRTYGEIARALGRPEAARAVARACATNPVSVAIPCHRVVRKDGGMGGYRWGLERKEALQRSEREGPGGGDRGT